MGTEPVGKVTHSKGWEFFLYRELQRRLALCNIAFRTFLIDSAKAMNSYDSTLLSGGARMLPNWTTYVVEYAFPLNASAEVIAREIEDLGSTPLFIRLFLSYQDSFRARRKEWEAGNLPDTELTADFNFPAGLDGHIIMHLASLLSEESPEFKHLTLLEYKSWRSLEQDSDSVSSPGYLAEKPSRTTARTTAARTTSRNSL